MFAIPFVSRSTRILAASLTLSLVTAAHAQDSVEFTNVVELAATVTALDQAERLITLRGPQDGELTLEAGPQVRNFSQLAVGDTVRLHYEISYGAERVDQDQAPEFEAAAAVGAARTEEGERPGGAIGMVESMIVLVESIGPQGRSATFITPDGGLQAIAVRHEQGRAFARTLSAGDLVQLTVAEAVAVFVEPLGL